jgi:nucleotide-binding universal stress UspA family protein
MNFSDYLCAFLLRRETVAQQSSPSEPRVREVAFTEEEAMPNWKTIIVGYDGKHASNLALLRAADLAEEAGAKLVVTSSARLLVGGARGVGPLDPADAPAEHIEELQHARELLVNRKLNVVYDLEIGDPDDAIVVLADRHKADLIVVGTHERGFLDRLLHGSVSEGVSRHAHCDVLIVRQLPR